jgi:hypothetical protein
VQNGPDPPDKRQHKIFLLSSAVEHSAVNRRVVGSNPTGGAREPTIQLIKQLVVGSFCARMVPQGIYIIGRSESCEDRNRKTKLKDG